MDQALKEKRIAESQAKRDVFHAKHDPVQIMRRKKWSEPAVAPVESEGERDTSLQGFMKSCHDQKGMSFYGRRHSVAGLLAGTACFWSMSRLLNGSLAAQTFVISSFLLVGGSGILADSLINDLECKQEYESTQLPQ